MNRLASLILTLLAFAACSVAPLAAQVLQKGDVVVPGSVVVDGFGDTQGVFYRIRDGVTTPMWQSSTYDRPRDLMVDDEGRLVFIATPASGNGNDLALFRIEPSTGQLERLCRFPYIVGSSDTLPSGVPGAISSFGGFGQSLHSEPLFTVTIDDTIQGGIPVLVEHESYGFAIATVIDGQTQRMAYRYRPDDGRWEAGVGLSLLTSNSPVVAMASAGNSIYYGCGSQIGIAGTPIEVNLHFGGGSSEVSAQLDATTQNELTVDHDILDNIEVPNDTVSCGTIEDTNVPMVGGGFSPIDVGTIGLIGGLLYDTSSSVSTGVPYMFDIQRRAPFLNPYVCQFYTAVTMDGPVPFWEPDGTPMSPAWTSPDGSGLLANIPGNGVASVGADGRWTRLDGTIPATGRPVRWTTGAVTGSGASTLVVRSDSLVRVLLTDSRGRRIGFDPGGALVNDFGAAGLAVSLGTGGWSHVIVIPSPLNGNYDATITGIGDGAYQVTACLTRSGLGGTTATALGTAHPATAEPRVLSVGAPLTLAWSGGPLGLGESPGSSSGFDWIGPVPASREVRFACRTTTFGRVRLEVFDTAGRRVAVLADGDRVAGRFAAVWGGTGGSGAPAPAGVYLARLTAPGVTATRRIVLTR